MQNVKQKEETTYFLENDTLVVYLARELDHHNAEGIKENVDLSQFEYVKTYIFDLQDYQSPYVKKKYKQLQNTKLHLYIRRLSL